MLPAAVPLASRKRGRCVLCPTCVRSEWLCRFALRVHASCARRGLALGFGQAKCGFLFLGSAGGWDLMGFLAPCGPPGACWGLLGPPPVLELGGLGLHKPILGQMLGFWALGPIWALGANFFLRPPATPLPGLGVYSPGVGPSRGLSKLNIWPPGLPLWINLLKLCCLDKYLGKFRMIPHTISIYFVLRV